MRQLTLVVVLSSIVTLCLLTFKSAAEEKKAAERDVPQYLQDISVTIRAGGRFGGAEGSGVFRVTKDKQVWIWTCGHLIEHARTTRKNDDGKTIVEFGDVQIIKVLTEEGRKVGELNFDAEVIRYSHAQHGDDLALLRLRSKAYQPTQSAEFYLDKKIPAIGTKLMHCGSLLGQLGSTSVTNGIVSQQGRVLFNNVIFDQTNAASFPGSSGGIICLESDGRYVGMLVRGAGETFGLYVPVRRMRDWAKKVGVEFAIDDSISIPSDDELKKKTIDDSMRMDSRAGQANKDGKEWPTRHLDIIPQQYLKAEEAQSIRDKLQQLLK